MAVKKKQAVKKKAVKRKTSRRKPANQIPDALVKAPKGKPITVEDPRPAA